MSAGFVLYPAIDLRRGRVVRLTQGDPGRQTVYGDDPAAAARRWLDAGARWLHTVNLDGAFGEADAPNRHALRRVLEEASGAGAKVQFGGGLRSPGDIESALELGVARVVLGTAAIESPALVEEAVSRFGAGAVAAGIDAWMDGGEGRVRVRGWAEDAGVAPAELGRRLAGLGVTTAIFTNIARDGTGAGPDLEASRRLAAATGLEVIASGGFARLEQITAARAAGLAGAILGRSLYEGQIDLAEALAEAPC